MQTNLVFLFLRFCAYSVPALVALQIAAITRSSTTAHNRRLQVQTCTDAIQICHQLISMNHGLRDRRVGYRGSRRPWGRIHSVGVLGCSRVPGYSKLPSEGPTDTRPLDMDECKVIVGKIVL